MSVRLSDGVLPFSRMPMSVEIADWAAGSYYSATGKGPQCSTLFANWGVFRYAEVSSGDRVLISQLDAALDMAKGGFLIELNNLALTAYTCNGATIVASDAVALATSLRPGLFTWVHTVTGGNHFLYCNGFVAGAGVAVAATASNAGNRFTVGVRSDLTSVTACGILGVGGRTGGVPTAAQISQWHRDCVTAGGIAAMPSETHRWDAKDAAAGAPASWTCKVSGEVLTKTGTPIAYSMPPVW